jgi:hypothetical protein
LGNFSEKLELNWIIDFLYQYKKIYGAYGDWQCSQEFIKSDLFFYHISL